MDICISHTTALRWLLHNENPAVGKRQSRADALPTAPPPKAWLQALSNILDANPPVEGSPSAKGSSNKAQPRIDGELCASEARQNGACQKPDSPLRPSEEEAETAVKANKHERGSGRNQGAKASKEPFDHLKDRRIHVLVGSAPARRELPGVVMHASTLKPQSGSFVRTRIAGKTVHVASPALVFLQMATLLPVQDLVAVGYALCSGYRLDKSIPEGICLRKDGDAPLTTVADLENYVREVGNVAGTHRAQVALVHIRGGSLSPMESALAMALGLPPKYGGFGLGYISMNEPLVLADGSDVGGKKTIARRPDILISAVGRDKKVRRAGVEYDATATHLEAKTAQRDATRRNEFQADGGLAHFTITAGHAADYLALMRVFDQVRRALNVRKRPWSPGATRLPSGDAETEKIRATWARQLALWKRYISGAKLTVGE